MLHAPKTQTRSIREENNNLQGVPSDSYKDTRTASSSVNFPYHRRERKQTMLASAPISHPQAAPPTLCRTTTLALISRGLLFPCWTSTPSMLRRRIVFKSRQMLRCVDEHAKGANRAGYAWESGQADRATSGHWPGTDLLRVVGRDLGHDKDSSVFRLVPGAA